MTVSAKTRANLPSSKLGRPKSGGYPMQDKKHAAIAKAFAAMHHAPDKAAIDAKADKILGKQGGGPVVGARMLPHLSGLARRPSIAQPGIARPSRTPARIV